LRIDGSLRSTGIGRRPGIGGAAAGSNFAIEDEVSAERVANADPVVATSGIDALLALQAVDDPLFARKKALRRGTNLLDTLDDIKADLLAGRVSEGRLNALMALVSSARERALPELDGLLDDIELRAKVELAKFGRYPA
jgi:hypothetical protein